MTWLFSWLPWLFKFIPFFDTIRKTIETITGKIIDLKVAQANAQTDQERIHAEENIKVLEAQRDILLKQTDRSEYITTLTRLGFAVPVALVVWKVLVVDKVLGSLLGCSGDTTEKPDCLKFTTDALDVNLWWIIFAAISFYFVQNLATIWKRP